MILFSWKKYRFISRWISKTNVTECVRETFVNYKRDSEIVSNELGREQVCRIYFFLGRFFISREKLKKDCRETTDNFPEIESLGIIIRKKQ